MPPLTNFSKSLLAVGIGNALCVGVSQAATINVVAGCSLIEAIHTANGTPSGTCAPAGDADTIVLPPVLPLYDTAISGAYGDSALPEITSDVTIQGDSVNGTSIVRDDTASDFRIATIAPGGNLTLSNVTISQGSANSGGGIFVYEGELTLISSVVSDNQSSDSGGGIFAYDSTLLLSNQSRVVNNISASGGGISIEYSSLTINNSSVESNEATSGYGGVRAYYPSLLQLDQATISQNIAASFAGGLGANSDGSPTGSVVIQNSQIVANKAYGIANGTGGGLWLNYLETNLTDTTLSENFAYVGGGGIYAKGAVSLTMQGGVVMDNSANFSVGSGGGLCFGEYIAATLSELTISGNSASQGGGILLNNDAQVTVNRSTVSNNEAAVNGGGISHAGTSLSLNTSTVSSNMAAAKGSGLFLNSGNSFITASTVFENVGAISVYANNLPAVQNSVIAGGNYQNCDFLGAQIVNSTSWFEDASCSGVANGDPLLGGLLDNNSGFSGLTLTHAPTKDSPLLGEGSDAICDDPEFAVDQRGASRDTCDIGAVEASPSDACFVVKASNGNVLTFCL